MFGRRCCRCAAGASVLQPTSSHHNRKWHKTRKATHRGITRHTCWLPAPPPLALVRIENHNTFFLFSRQQVNDPTGQWLLPPPSPPDPIPLPPPPSHLLRVEIHTQAQNRPLFLPPSLDATPRPRAHCEFSKPPEPMVPMKEAQTQSSHLPSNILAGNDHGLTPDSLQTSSSSPTPLGFQPTRLG